MLDDYQKRKQKRKEKYKNEKGKKKTCGACNGSGYYDVTGSPPCAACDGTGKG